MNTSYFLSHVIDSGIVVRQPIALIAVFGSSLDFMPGNQQSVLL